MNFVRNLTLRPLPIFVVAARHLRYARAGELRVHHALRILGEIKDDQPAVFTGPATEDNRNEFGRYLTDPATSERCTPPDKKPMLQSVAPQQ